MDIQEAPQPEKLPDLRKKSKKELQDLCLHLGMARDEMERMERWSLVKYVKNNARDELSNLYREHKQNQQEQNRQFQEQVNVQFEDQRKWLTGKEQFVLSTSTIAFANFFDSLVQSSSRIESLRAPTELNDALPDIVVPGMEKSVPIAQSKPITSAITTVQMDDGSKKPATQLIGPNGQRLLVRRVTLTVQKDGRIIPNITYTHNPKDIRNVLEQQRRLDSLSLIDILHRYNGYDPTSQPIHKMTKTAPRSHKPRSMVTQRVGFGVAISRSECVARRIRSVWSR